jgi:hypothetical protein
VNENILTAILRLNEAKAAIAFPGFEGSLLTTFYHAVTR